MSADLTADQINLSDSGFWGRPFEERDTAFRVLRDQRPVAFLDEPPWPFLPPGPGYWAVTRFDDVVEASRNPAVFSSADGSVLPDLPPGGPPFLCALELEDAPENPRRALARSLVRARNSAKGCLPGRAYVPVSHTEIEARVNITLPDDLLSQARAGGLNVSRLAAAALADELDRRGAPASRGCADGVDGSTVRSPRLPVRLERDPRPVRPPDQAGTGEAGRASLDASPGPDPTFALPLAATAATA